MAVVTSLDTLSCSASATFSEKKTDGTISGAPFVPRLDRTLGLSSNFTAKSGVLVVGTLAAAGTVDIDLRTLKDWYQEFLFLQAVTAARKVKLIAIINDSVAGTDADLEIGPPVALGFIGPWRAAGNRILVGVGTPPQAWPRQAGYADDLTTNYKVTITNLSATAVAAYRLLVAGSDT